MIAVYHVSMGFIVKLSIMHIDTHSTRLSYFFFFFQIKAGFFIQRLQCAFGARTSVYICMQKCTATNAIINSHRHFNVLIIPPAHGGLTMIIWSSCSAHAHDMKWPCRVGNLLIYLSTTVYVCIPVSDRPFVDLSTRSSTGEHWRRVLKNH